MPSQRALTLVVCGCLVAALPATPCARAQDAPGFAPPSSQAPAQPEAPLPQPPPIGAVDSAPAGLPGPGSEYDPAIFLHPLPKNQLAFLAQYSGMRSGEVWKDKQFRKIAKQFISDCVFHYGYDKPLDIALDEVLSGSLDPALLRQGRYLLISGSSGPFLGGRGFLWIDLQEGIGLGGFYFHPTNGEPTPTLTVFARQVPEKALGMSNLPLAFADDLNLWAEAERIPPLTTRYFIGGINRRLLLEHDEDFCTSTEDSPAPPPDVCQRMNADAADIDMNTACYLKQIDYATNGTAWMITGADQTAWIGIRDNMCGGLLGCRIHATHEHIHVITGRAPASPHPVPRPPTHPPQHPH